jgi:hypothetical protein
LLVALVAFCCWASEASTDAEIADAEIATVGGKPPLGMGVAIVTPVNFTKKNNRTRQIVPAREGQLEERLIGLEESDVVALLGAPNSQHDQAPGKSWVYDNGRCTLDLSFYLDVQSRVFRTLAYEVTSHDNSAERRRLCVAELQSRKGTR